VAATVVIDCFPESAERYGDGFAVVAIDVIRATTTATTAVALGRRCFPVPSLEAAVPLAARLQNPLLIGELGGNMPYGFDLNNSPAALLQLMPDERPLILISTSGTQLFDPQHRSDAVYAACLRNYTAAARLLAQQHERVALIGAGTRGEFREEDQLCCAWIAERLLDSGYVPGDQRTRELVEVWRGSPVAAINESNSAEYLRRSGQLHDLDFVLTHVDDLDLVCKLDDGELVPARI
jgi:2-phosphosulfolactate phosphatase